MCEEKRLLLLEMNEAIAALKRIGSSEDGTLELRVKKASEALNRHVAEHDC